MLTIDSPQAKDARRPPRPKKVRPPFVPRSESLREYFDLWVTQPVPKDCRFCERILLLNNVGLCCTCTQKARRKDRQAHHRNWDTQKRKPASRPWTTCQIDAVLRAATTLPAVFSSQELCVAAWKECPERFSIKGIPESYPDHKTISALLARWLLRWDRLVRVGPNMYRLAKGGQA